MQKEDLSILVKDAKSIKEISKLINKSPTTVKYWLLKFDLKINKELKDSKICPHCQINKCISKFNTRRNGKNLSTYCKVCTSLQTTQRQQKLKQEAIEYKGNKCLACNYNTYQGALEFHHLDPSEKEFNISQAKHLSFNRIKSELDKCILLCSNCHKEIHAGLLKYNTETNSITSNLIIKNTWQIKPSVKSMIDLKEIELRLKNKETLQSISSELNITPDYLSFLLTQEGIYTSEMTEQQDILHPKKIKWPSIEEMQKLVWEKSTIVLAKELGVSDVAIAKFCKKHNITKPQRGYWAKQKALSN